jgi:hypothetical protein
LVLPDENVPNPLEGFGAPKALDTLLPPNIGVVLLEVTEVELGVPNNVLGVPPPPKILPPAVGVAPNTFLEDDSAGGAEPRPLKKPPPPPNMLPPLDAEVDFVSVFPPKIEEAVEAAETVGFSDTCNVLAPKIDVDEDVLLAKVVTGEDAI